MQPNDETTRINELAMLDGALAWLTPFAGLTDEERHAIGVEFYEEALKRIDVRAHDPSGVTAYRAVHGVLPQLDEAPTQTEEM